jgi:hypothetical protein
MKRVKHETTTSATQTKWLPNIPRPARYHWFTGKQIQKLFWSGIIKKFNRIRASHDHRHCSCSNPSCSVHDRATIIGIVRRPPEKKKLRSQEVDEKN